MSDIEIVASLERMFQNWLDENCDDMDVGWYASTLSRNMAIAAAQMLWVQRDTTAVVEEQEG